MKYTFVLIISIIIVIAMSSYLQVDLNASSSSSYLAKAFINDGNLNVECILASSNHIIDSIYYTFNGDQVCIRIYEKRVSHSSNVNNMGTMIFSVKLPEDICHLKVYKQGFCLLDKTPIAQFDNLQNP